MHFPSPFMIGPMDPLFPAGISVLALMWVVPCLVCVGRPLAPVCVAAGEVKGYMRDPFLLWQCLDVARDPECTINQQIQEQMQL